jgi:hypothetical protein
MILYLSRIIGPASRTIGTGADTLTYTLPDEARDCERETCAACGRDHDVLWRIVRRPLASFGPWPVARILERDARGRYARAHVIDPSLPTAVAELPADAARLAPAEAARLWHDDNESHTFGGPNVAAALRAMIARANAS